MRRFLKNPDNQILLFIILWAAALRFYRFWEIPFTHDELSALFRLHFDSFSELISGGVYTDNHPPGVQIFLYYYTGIFGEKEWIFKLPFLLMGLGSVYLIYRIGKLWENPTAGLLAAAVMATSQFFVMYSQIARPYAAGCLTVLLAVFYWSKYWTLSDKWNRNLIWWTLWAAVSCYVHHLSLLAIFLVGVSGLFRARNNKVLPYLLSCMAVILIYLPNLPVFITQLNRGGLSDWLGSPANDFYTEFLKWVFHFSPWFGIPVLFIAIVGLFRSDDKVNYRLFIVGFSWFVITALIGFIYSRNVAPVLQYSLLIFTFPFSLLLIFSPIKLNTYKVRWVAVGIILAGGTGSLIFGRHYYKVFYSSVYESAPEHLSSHDITNTPIWLSGRVDINEYYLDQYGIDPNRVVLISDTMKTAEILKLVRGYESDEIVISYNHNAPPSIISAALDHYPFIEKYSSFYNGEFYVLRRTTMEGSEKYAYIQGIPDLLTTVSSGMIDIEPTVFNHIDQKGFIDVKCYLRSNRPLKDVELNLGVFASDSIIFWRAVPAADFYTADSLYSYPVILSARLFLTDLSKADKIRTMIWNKSGEEIQVDSMKVQFRERNPSLYKHMLN